MERDKSMSRQTTVGTVGRWMNGVFGALALFMVEGIGGCGGTPPGDFIILQNQVPNADCSIPATLGAVYRGEGLVDVRLVGDSAASAYVLFPLLQNDFPAPSGGQDVDANRIILSGFDVDVGLPPTPGDGPITDLITGLRALSPDDPDHELIQYSTLTSGSVASGGGNTASAVGVFPAELARRMRDMGVLSRTSYVWIMASVRARGDTLVGGVRSDSFKYPIRVCDGCLVEDTGVCPADVSTLGSAACYPGQDGASVCCEAASGSLFCL
jgi:hypothetical protein